MKILLFQILTYVSVGNFTKQNYIKEAKEIILKRLNKKKTH
jgi:hypothetical protein